MHPAVHQPFREHPLNHSPTIRTLSAGLLFALTAWCLPAAAGPLTGQTLGATGTGVFPASAVVGAGREFKAGQGFEFDFADDGLLSVGVFQGITVFTNTSDYVFTDLNGTIASITGVTLLGFDAGATGFDASDISFTADSVTLRLASTRWSDVAHARLQIDFAPAAVPEPPGIALVALALLGIRASQRGRNGAPQVV